MSKLCILLCFCLLFLLLATSCSGTNQTLPQDFGEQPSGKLTVYLDPYLFMENIIPIYEAMYPNVELDLRQFETSAEFSATLLTDLLSGRGPDLVYFYTWTFKNIDKLIESGVFLDVNPLFKADGGITWDTYQGAVMDMGVYEGKRYFTPLDYRLPLLVTTEEALLETNFNLAGADKFSSFTAEIDKYLQIHPERPVVFSSALIGPTAISDYLWYSGTPWTDFKNGSAEVASTNFRSVVEAYKTIYPQIYQTPLKNFIGTYNLSNYDGVYSLRGENALFASYQEGLSAAVSTLSGLAGVATPRLFAVPNQNGGVTAFVNSMAGICANSENQTAAFALLKLLLSEQVQQHDRLSFTPVLKSAAEQQWDKFMAKQIIGYDGENDVMFAHPPVDVREAYVSILNSVDSCLAYSSELDQFAMDALIPYFEGQKNLEECLRQLENTLFLYVNE